MILGTDSEFFRNWTREVRREVTIATLYRKVENTWRFNYTLADLDDKLNPGVPVEYSPAKYLAVADAVTDGKIALVQRTPDRDAIAVYQYGNPPTLAADFERRADWTAFDQSAVVHECTHALNAMVSPRHLTIITNELTGFLAQTIFLKVVGAPLPKGGDPAWDNIFVEADALASRFFLYNGTPAKLTRADYAALRAAVAKIYGYPSEMR